MDFLKGLDKVLDIPILNTMGGVIDGIGKSLGMSEGALDVVKVAAGFVTGNPVLVANGVAGLAKNIDENPAASTEVWNGKARAGGEDCKPAGYAQDTHAATAGNPVANLLFPRPPFFDLITACPCCRGTATASTRTARSPATTVSIVMHSRR